MALNIPDSPCRPLQQQLSAGPGVFVNDWLALQSIQLAVPFQCKVDSALQLHAALIKNSCVLADNQKHWSNLQYCLKICKLQQLQLISTHGNELLCKVAQNSIMNFAFWSRIVLWSFSAFVLINTNSGP